MNSGEDIQLPEGIRQRLEQASAVLAIFAVSLVMSDRVADAGSGFADRPPVSASQKAPPGIVSGGNKGEQHIGEPVSGVFGVHNGQVFGIYDARPAPAEK